MKRIERIEKGLVEKNNWSEIGINATLGWAYIYSKEADNDVPNFAECIWDDEIPEIVEQMKELDIHEFTISSTFSGLIQTIVTFEDLGCTLEGTVQINERYAREKGSTIPAFKMSI